MPRLSRLPPHCQPTDMALFGRIQGLRHQETAWLRPKQMLLRDPMLLNNKFRQQAHSPSHLSKLQFAPCSSPDMHLSTLILAGAATVVVAQTTTPSETSSAISGPASLPPPTSAGGSFILPRPTTTQSPCNSLYWEFSSNPKLIPPPVLGDWLAESTRKYFETYNPSTVTRQPQFGPPTDEQISKSCSARLAERTLTDLPESVATVYSSFTSEWSSFVATAKTQAKSIASVCSSSGETFEASLVLESVATELADCVSAWKLRYPGSTTSDLPSTTSGSQSTLATTTSGAGTASTSSTSSTVSTGGAAAKETGFAVAAIMAAAGVVGLL